LGTAVIPESTISAERVPARALWVLLLGIGVGWLPILLGHQVVARVSGLYGLGAGPHPYFQPALTMLLYCSPLLSC